MIISCELLKDIGSLVWMVSSEYEPKLSVDKSSIFAQNISTGQSKIKLTLQQGMYEGVRGIFDKENRLWVVYTQYQEGKRRILLTCLKRLFYSNDGNFKWVWEICES